MPSRAEDRWVICRSDPKQMALQLRGVAGSRIELAWAGAAASIPAAPTSRGRVPHALSSEHAVECPGPPQGRRFLVRRNTDARAGAGLPHVQPPHIALGLGLRRPRATRTPAARISVCFRDSLDLDNRQGFPRGATGDQWAPFMRSTAGIVRKRIVRSLASDHARIYSVSIATTRSKSVTSFLPATCHGPVM